MWQRRRLLLPSRGRGGSAVWASLPGPPCSKCFVSVSAGRISLSSTFRVTSGGGEDDASGRASQGGYWANLLRHTSFSVACNAQRTYRYASRCRLRRASSGSQLDPVPSSATEDCNPAPTLLD